MIGEVAGHREFTAIERGVADAVKAVFSDDLEGDEVSPRAADDYLGINNLHECFPCVLGTTAKLSKSLAE